MHAKIIINILLSVPFHIYANKEEKIHFKIYRL